MDLAVISNLYFASTIENFTDTVVPYYGNVVDADNYFTRSLKKELWHQNELERKIAALTDATRLIDSLNYNGQKVDSEQPLEFPRKIRVRKLVNCVWTTEVVTQSVVPPNIEKACYEVALCLLDGYEPDMEIENLSSTSQGLGGVRDTYDRSSVLEHIRAGIPSSVAWNLLKPFLIDPSKIRICRVN